MNQPGQCLRRTRAVVGGCALGLLLLACEPPPRERAADRSGSTRPKRLASEEEAQRAPDKPTSPVAAPGAAEPPLRASEVPQRFSPDDLPSPKQLPVAEDFQAETTAAIGRGNYHYELDSLESEVKSDTR